MKIRMKMPDYIVNIFHFARSIEVMLYPRQTGAIMSYNLLKTKLIQQVKQLSIPSVLNECRAIELNSSSGAHTSPGKYAFGLSRSGLTGLQCIDGSRRFHGIKIFDTGVSSFPEGPSKSVTGERHCF
jgi:hypothetical protein